MKEYLVPKYLLPFIAIVFILSFLIISIKNQSPRGLYAVCGDEHIVLSGSRVMINTTPYKVRKIFLTDRVVWNRHAEHCTGGINPFYRNTFYSFEWDIDSKKAEYYENSAVRSFTRKCTIPDAPPPDWVVVRGYDKKSINLDCS
jgi:hypothetical protein